MVASPLSHRLCRQQPSWALPFRPPCQAFPTPTVAKPIMIIRWHVSLSRPASVCGCLRELRHVNTSTAVGVARGECFPYGILGGWHTPHPMGASDLPRE